MEADCNLRAWGADTYLDVKGMFKTRLTTKKGAKKDTVVYVVGGTRPEPLLGDADAEDLGIIVFKAEGREATKEEKEGKEEEKVNKVNEDNEHKGRSIPSKLRRAGKIVKTEKPHIESFTEQEKKETMKIVKSFEGSVFTDKIGLMKTKPVQLQYEEGFQPIQPHRYGVPYHYQKRLG